MHEINFIISKDSKIACFWEKRFYITDDSFTPELVYETESFANAVSLSDSSKYAIFQTAYNAKNDEDSGAFAIIDVEKREVINKGAIETGWKGMTHLYIDEDKKCFWVYYGNERVKYGFDLSPDAKTLEQYEIKCPALLICGTQDHAGSCIRYNKAWHRNTKIPLTWIEGAGHNSNTDKPEQVNRLIDEFAANIL